MIKNFISTNLKHLRILNGIEQSQISELLNKKSTSAISEWEKGLRIPSVGDLHDLANFFNVNLDDFVKKDLRNIEIPSFKESKFERSYKYFPVSISAGCLENIDGIKEYDLINISDAIMGKYAGRSNVILLKVNGDSMNKIIPDKSFIVVDTSKNNSEDLKDRDIVVFSNEGQYSVKRYIHDSKNQRFIFRPESTEDVFTDIVISYENASELKVIGKVVKYIVDLV